MGADVIQSQYEQLDVISQRFDKNAQTHAAIQRQVQSSMNHLRSAWAGRGSEAFFSEMTSEVLPALQRLSKALAEAGSVTRQISAILRAAEEDAAKPFQSESEASQPGLKQGGSGTSWWSRFGEKVHGGLDVLGFVPIAGEIADGVNGLIYLGEGRGIEAGISFAAMLPILGDVGKAGKWVVKGGKEILETGAERLVKEGAGEAAGRVVREGGGETAERVAKGVDSHPLKFGELAPNTAYARNGHEYLTDEVGRVSRASGDLQLQPGARTPHQTEVGRLGLNGDEGGHLIGTRFGGTPEGVNLVPENMNLNRGAWKQMENEWAGALEQGKQVKVDIKVVYPTGNSVRPDQFVVRYTVDGRPYKQIFRNVPGG